MSNPYEQFLSGLDFGEIISPISGQVGSVFGDNRDGGKRKHMAYDLPAPAGTALIAPTDMEFVQGGVGGTNLRPNDRWAHFRVPGTHYEWRIAHQGEVPEAGFKVKRGEPFGTVGSAIKGTHLHIGLYNTATGEYEDWGTNVGVKRGSSIEAGTQFASAIDKRAGAVAAEVDPYSQFLPKTGVTQGANPYEAMAQNPRVAPTPKMGFSEAESWNPLKNQDFSDKYNTAIPPERQQEYQQWLQDISKQLGRDFGKDIYSYDIQGAFLKGLKPGADAHWPDTFKKPNHPTFSDESKYNLVDGHQGGSWQGEDFTPPNTWTPAPPAQPAGIPPEQIVAPGEAGQVNAPEGTGKALAQAVAPVAAPILRAGGLVGGGIVGSGASPGVGTVAGAGLGFAMGKKAGEALEAYAGQRETPTIAESVKQTAQDIPTGAMYEMGGQIGGKVLGKGLELAGRGLRPVLGRMSGVGTGAVEEALKGSQDFVKALRGKLTGEEVVENAQTALQVIRNNRAANYQAQLANVAKVNDEIDLTPLRQKVANLMKQYGAKVDITPKGELQFDTSRIAMGKKGRGDIEDILETVSQWGTRPGDKTPLGLDTLKRQLDDFYSESSQARAFVTTMRNTVKDLIVKNVPEYAEMTKGYAETTKLIKDIEAGLMMRKQGMTGRIVADQTLRRLVSSMKDNFELRRELVDMLGGESGQDVAGQVAGHAMNAVLPRGLAGLATITEGGLALAKFINPKIWPFLVASSPRVQGEFLQAMGKALKETKGMSMPVGKVTSYLSLMQQEAQKDDRNPFKKQADTLIQQGKREDAVTLLRDAATKGKITVEKAVEWLGDTNPTMSQAPRE